MPVKIIGQTPETVRWKTGLLSLDCAFDSEQRNLGIPLDCGWHLFGVTHTGKSTFAYSLASLLAAQRNSDWVLADLEGFDSNFVLRIAENMGMQDQKIYVVSGDKKQNYSDESIGDEFLEKITKPEIETGVFDSIAALSPVPEKEGTLGEANMGVRARILGQMSRKGLPLWRNKEQVSTMLLINHWYPRVAGKGYEAPGGKVKDYLCTVHVKLSQNLAISKTLKDGSYVLDGEVYKNRWGGGKGNKFQVVIKAGYGIHLGLTAMFDCFTLGLAQRSKTIKIGDESLGYLKDFFLDYQNEERFQPFFDLLRDVEHVRSV